MAGGENPIGRDESAAADPPAARDEATLGMGRVGQVGVGRIGRIVANRDRRSRLDRKDKYDKKPCDDMSHHQQSAVLLCFYGKFLREKFSAEK